MFVLIGWRIFILPSKLSWTYTDYPDAYIALETLLIFEDLVTNIMFELNYKHTKLLLKTSRHFNSIEL